MESIAFSKNWNNKLNCNYFTTIRPKTDKYKINEVYQVVDNSKSVENFKAKCVILIHAKLEDIPALTIYLDCGFDKAGFHSLMKSFYKERAESLMYSIILLNKLT